jgi:MmgE/PrpD N-terminal domain
VKVAPVDWRNQFLDSLSGETVHSAELDQRLEVLLTDYLVAARAGRELAHMQHIGANLAMNSSADDADDIDWSVITHPGSIIWSALLHQIFAFPESATRFKNGAYAAYQTSASIAGFFGASHRAKWHVTTTAGTFAAATASNVLRQATPEQSLSSLLHVAANMGGIAVADRRTGAAIFNRGAAVTLGILASEAALSGIPHAANIWDGDRGLVALFSLSNDPKLATIRDGISTAGLRLFPCNGFVQSAYMAIADCRAKLDGDLLSMRVGLTEAMVPFLDGSVGGDHWSAHHAAAKAWDPAGIKGNLPLIEIVGGDIPLGGAKVEVKTTAGEMRVLVERAPGADLFSENEQRWRSEKHQRLIGQAESVQAEKFAQQLLAGECDLVELKSFIS